MMDDLFVKISTRLEHLDLYVIRSSIKNALQKRISIFHGKLLDVGCGKMPYRAWISNSSSINSYTGIDLDLSSSVGYNELVKPDLFWDGKVIPFEANYFETIICTEVLEHVPDTIAFLSEIFRVLKPGGIFFFTTPFIWPLHDVPYDEKRITPFGMRNSLDKIGFFQIDIKPLGGWHASMALFLGIWVRRSGLPNKIKLILSCVLRPIIFFLYRKDVFPEHFYEGQMITGIYGIAQKK